MRSDLGSVDVGSPIYYRRLQVGQIIAYELAPDGKSVQLKVFINAPYDRFVFPETRFWNATGIDVSLGTEGINIRTESLAALLVGGLSFDTPPTVTSTTPAAADTAFTLFSDRVAAMRATDPNARRYVLYFNESLRGLSVGAPVTFLGLPAGEVTSVGLAFDATTGVIRPRVVITFSPERLLAYGNVPAEIQKFRTGLQDEQKRADAAATPHRGTRSARAIEERQPADRAALRGARLLSGLAQGEGRSCARRKSSCRSFPAPSPCSRPS